MKTMIAHYVRTILLFAIGAAVLASACLLRATPVMATVTPRVPVAAQPAVPAAVAGDNADATPLTRDHLLSSLARSIGAHFSLEGDLQLELLRAWTPPASGAARCR